MEFRVLCRNAFDTDQQRFLILRQEDDQIFLSDSHCEAIPHGIEDSQIYRTLALNGTVNIGSFTRFFSVDLNTKEVKALDDVVSSIHRL